jgi:hypothetical protein
MQVNRSIPSLLREGIIEEMFLGRRRLEDVLARPQMKISGKILRPRGSS